MSNTPISSDAKAWDRYYGATANNRAWDLLALPERSAAQTEELVRSAHTAAWHWARVNSALHSARADVLLANMLVATDDAVQARIHADRALDFFNSNQCADWDLPFVHLALARVGAATADNDLQTWHYNEARLLGETIEEEDDREVFFEEFARVPPP